MIKDGEKKLASSLANANVGMNPGLTQISDVNVGLANESYQQSSQLASNLKSAGQILDAAGKFADVAKEGIKLNDAIKAAEKEQETNSAATDVAESNFLQYVRSRRKAGKLTEKEYIRTVKSYIASTNQSQVAGLDALVVDEWIAGATFVENSLAGLGGKATKVAQVAGDFLGSLWR